MKNTLATTVLSAVLAATLALLPAVASAADQNTSDRASQSLAHHGSVSVKSAGPYVEIGTLQIQVSSKLGRPSVRLPDGAWLYSGFAVDGSAAAGTLLVRFRDGRVSSLRLVSSAVSIVPAAQQNVLASK